jgi:hypothetical protein
MNEPVLSCPSLPLWKCTIQIYDQSTFYYFELKHLTVQENTRCFIDKLYRVFQQEIFKHVHRKKGMKVDKRQFFVNALTYCVLRREDLELY